MAIDPNLELPGDLDRKTLIDIHNEILATSYHIRVNSRWGDYTEYSVKINAARALQISGLPELPPDVPWRLCFGVERASDQFIDDVVDVQMHDQDLREWITVLYDGETDTFLADVSHVVREATAYLQRKHPVARLLLEIDRRLLTVLN